MKADNKEKAVKKAIDSIKKDYEFLNIFEEDIYNLYIVKIAGNSKIEEKNLEHEIRAELSKYIQENIPEDVFSYLLCEKLNTELKPIKNSLDMLENISTLLKRLGYKLSIELAKNIGSSKSSGE